MKGITLHKAMNPILVAILNQEVYPYNIKEAYILRKQMECSMVSNCN